MKNIRLTLIILLSFFIKEVIAQSSHRFRHYDTRDGLASEEVQTIMQDSLGFIWVHYYGAITRFDGYTFKVYQFDPEDSSRSVGPGQLSYMLQDKSGNPWIYKWAGGKGKFPDRYFLRYNRAKDRFEPHKIYVESQVFSSIEISDSCIWFAGAQGAGLFSYNYITKKTKSFLNQVGDSILKVNNNSLRGLIDQGSYLLLGSREGLWKFDKREKRFFRPECHPADSNFLYHNEIAVAGYNKALLNFKETGIDPLNFESWILAKGEIIPLSKDFSMGRGFSLPQDVNHSGFAVSSDGKVWMATKDQGLLILHPNSDSITYLKKSPMDPFSLRSNWLTSVIIDRDENVWVGLQEEGISVLKKPDLQFANHKIEGFGNTAVYEAKGKDYVVVAATDKWPPTSNSEYSLMISPLQKQSHQSLRFEKIPTPVSLRKGILGMIKGRSNFWFTSPESRSLIGLPLDPVTGKILTDPVIQYKNDPNNHNTIGTPIRVREDNEGSLWIGTYLDGLVKINTQIPYGTEGSIEKFVHNESDPTSISNNLVHSIFPAGDDSFWVDTESGIDLFKNGTFTKVFKGGVHWDIHGSPTKQLYVGASDGLYICQDATNGFSFKKSKVVKHAVLAIEEDGLGRLWLSSLEGIICFDPKEDIALFFNEEDGIDHTHGIIEKTSYGALVTANIEGITIFDPLSLKINKSKTNPVLTNLLVNNVTPDISDQQYGENFSISNDISLLDELTLDYSHNNFTVEYAAMQLTAPSKNLYRHMLDGYDKSWIETDYKNRTATYTNLPSGTYTFRVKASNHHGVWSDNERTLKVIILPPPWRTWWAYSGYGLMVAGLLVWARKNIVQRERLKSSLALAKVEQEKEHFELEKAKEVDKVKTSFFTNISHEFRTPLTLIKGPVQNILDRYKDDPKLQEQLKLVQRNSDLLLKLINQLLDLAKLESGSLKVEKTEGDVFSFVRAIASSFESFARQKNVSIQVNVPEGSCDALFDKDKVETILINLINNAVKFTPSGGSVIITASLSPNAQGLVFSVRDTGIGIPPDHQSKIFERFHQVSEAHKEVGTGIGLALVKELVTLMGGEIAVTSEVGVGSEFTVHIPIELVASNQLPVTGDQTPVTSDQPETGNWKPATESTLKEHGQSAKPHILVVEDNTDLRHFIIDSLGNEFHFLEAENGKQGLDIATNEIPDLIISDVMMPEMDGITMAGKIKTDIRTSHVPLILLTAKSSEDSKLSGLSSGADDYLTKPFNKNELLLKVRNGVNRQLKLRERLRAELMSTASKIEVLSEDEKFLNSVKEKILERLSDEQLSVESLSDDIGMSRVQLYRKVSGLTGISVNELIRKLRLQRAAQLLQQKWGPVSQVAYEVGFSNLSYFSKVFKEEFGVLPSEYTVQ
jgi:signal transduction histidine kinase/DNA-binding response OmpR family regulator/ligand-binding sensor domain-containing protein